jgi:hypothetical protein
MNNLQQDYRIFNFTTDKRHDAVLNDIHNLCLEAQLDTHNPANENMSTINWENKSHSLLYLLEKTDRFHFKNGMFTVLYDNNSNRIIACSGIYRSHFDPAVGIGGVRTWIVRDYRTKYLVSKYIIPWQFSWCCDNKLKIFALTFNEYNYKLMLILNRSGKYSNQRNNYIMGIKRELIYQNMKILNRMSCIQGINQYVMYQKLDPEYTVNFPDAI